MHPRLGRFSARVIAETIGKGNGRLISRAAFRGLVGSKPSEIAGDADAFRWFHSV